MPKLSDGTPYIVIGNNELAQQPDLGNTISCWICGKDHPVEYGQKVNEYGMKKEYRGVAFMKCGDKSYLCGVGGKEWRPK